MIRILVWITVAIMSVSPANKALVEDRLARNELSWLEEWNEDGFNDISIYIEYEDGTSSMISCLNWGKKTETSVDITVRKDGQEMVYYFTDNESAARMLAQLEIQAAYYMLES